jgi:hypothetical protein
MPDQPNPIPQISESPVLHPKLGENLLGAAKAYFGSKPGDRKQALEKFLSGVRKQSGKQNIYMSTNTAPGMKESGTLDVANRPVVRNADGSVSTEYSFSRNDPKKNLEVLVPSVVNGKFMTPTGEKPPEGSPAEKAMFDAAWGHYQNTGEHLGAFDTPENADNYANWLHTRQDARVNGPTGEQ